MLRVFFLDTVTPKKYAISPKDTLFAMLIHKKFEIPVATIREAVGKTTPSKHETSCVMHYGNLCIVGPNAKNSIEHTFPQESDKPLRDHYKFLKSVFPAHREPTIGQLKRTQSDVLSWFKDAKVEKRNKKSSLVMSAPPPLLFYTHPF